MLRKARMQGARFRPLLERQTSHLKNNNIAYAFNQQSYLLTLTNINLISTETYSEPLLNINSIACAFNKQSYLLTFTDIEILASSRKKISSQPIPALCNRPPFARLTKKSKPISGLPSPQ
jgi:hypothetical protein